MQRAVRVGDPVEQLWRQSPLFESVFCLGELAETVFGEFAEPESAPWHQSSPLEKLQVGLKLVGGDLCAVLLPLQAFVSQHMVKHLFAQCLRD